MKNILAVSALVGALLFTIGSTASLADETRVITGPVSVESSTVTTVSEPSSVAITTTAPNYVFMGPGLEPIVIQTTLEPAPMLVTTTRRITGVKIYKPDDLLTRRDGLIARIVTEKAHGTLAGSTADNLLQRVRDVDSKEASLKANGFLTWKEVKKLYGRYDEIGSDLDHFSSDHKKMVAGSYLIL